ncbi:MAG: LysM peptidoglycan-binding domain-containing protein, partial [Holosporales bacterium]|nr:LysM peptidoglycan-binding domain-containing protein [Holosporales bacterium]
MLREPPLVDSVPYVVRAGDTLAIIASRFGTTPQGLARLIGCSLPMLLPKSRFCVVQSRKWVH